MKIYNWADLTESDFPSGTCLTIGVFDGIHAGHKKLFEEVVHFAEEKNLLPGFVTFSDGIFSMFKNSEKPLQSLEERIQKAGELGMEFCILIDFTPEIARTDGLEFLSVLKNKCHLSFLVEGEDFRLGDGGRTGKKEIQDFCNENKIEVFFVAPVLYNGQRISSTMIRKMIAEGDFENARKFIFC